MATFRVAPKISLFDSWAAFKAELGFGARDLLVTNRFIYEGAIKAAGFDGPVIFQEKYGQGEQIGRASCRERV